MTMFDAPVFTRTGTSPDGFGRTSRSVDAPVLARASVTRTSERSTSNSPAPALKSSDVGTSLAITHLDVRVVAAERQASRAASWPPRQEVLASAARGGGAPSTLARAGTASPPH